MPDSIENTVTFTISAVGLVLSLALGGAILSLICKTYVKSKQISWRELVFAGIGMALVVLPNVQFFEFVAGGARISYQKTVEKVVEDLKGYQTPPVDVLEELELPPPDLELREPE